MARHVVSVVLVILKHPSISIKTFIYLFFFKVNFCTQLNTVWANNTNDRLTKNHHSNHTKHGNNNRNNPENHRNRMKANQPQHIYVWIGFFLQLVASFGEASNSELALKAW